MNRLRTWWKGFVARNLVAQGAENNYYAWADARLDELAAEKRRAVQKEADVWAGLEANATVERIADGPHDEHGPWCRDPICPVEHPDTPSTEALTHRLIFAAASAVNSEPMLYCSCGVWQWTSAVRDVDLSHFRGQEAADTSGHTFPWVRREEAADTSEVQEALDALMALDEDRFDAIALAAREILRDTLRHAEAADPSGLRETVLAAFEDHKRDHGESCDCDLGIVLGNLSDAALRGATR